MSIPKEPEQVMKLRGGTVLGKKTILKSDHFPGCQNKRLSPHINGAPNYRRADSEHVHGVAIPTIGGIPDVLNHIGAQQIDGKLAQVLWINLREEPVFQEAIQLETSKIVADNFPSSEDAIRRGEYAVIRNLIRVLEGGVEGKRQENKVIDKCASMQDW